MKTETPALIEIIVVDRGGKEHRLLWESDQSLMEAIRDNDLPVLASCGGSCACGTCHVYVEPQRSEQLGDPSDDELAMLADSDVMEPTRSRLACQIRFSEECAGMKVRLAPHE